MVITVTDEQTNLLAECDYSNWHGVCHRIGVSQHSLFISYTNLFKQLIHMS